MSSTAGASHAHTFVPVLGSVPEPVPESTPLPPAPTTPPPPGTDVAGPPDGGSLPCAESATTVAPGSHAKVLVTVPTADPRLIVDAIVSFFSKKNTGSVALFGVQVVSGS